MKLDDVVKVLEAEVIHRGRRHDENEASHVVASDLMSDALANAAESARLITVLAHVNVIAVCSAVGLSAVLICRGRPVPPDTRHAARREAVAILATARNAYRASLAVGRAFGHAADVPVPPA